MNEQGTQDAQTQAGPATTININPPTAAAPGIVGYPPGPQVAAVDPLAPLIGLLGPVAQQAAQQAVAAITAGLQGQVAGMEKAVAEHIAGSGARITALEIQGAKGATQALPAIIANVESDPGTQRAVVLMVVGAALVAALAIVAFAMLGNVTANRWIGAAPGLVVGAALWVSRAGALGPAKPATKGA